MTNLMSIYKEKKFPYDIQEKELYRAVAQLHPISEEFEPSIRTSLFAIAQEALEWLAQPYSSEDWKPLSPTILRKELRRCYIYTTKNEMTVRLPLKLLRKSNSKNIWQAAEITFFKNCSSPLVQERMMQIPKKRYLKQMETAFDNYTFLKNCPNLMKSEFSTLKYMQSHGRIENRIMRTQKHYHDLYSLLNNKPELSSEKRFYILYEVCKALRYLHKHKYLWGNLKSSNILLNEGLNKVRISDLDGAIHIGKERNHVPGFVTIPSSAPEIAKAFVEIQDGTAITEKADMVSLAFLIIELMDLELNPSFGIKFQQLFCDHLMAYLNTPKGLSKELEKLKATNCLRKWILALNSAQEPPEANFWERLIFRLLKVNPDERPSISEVMKELKEYGKAKGYLEDNTPTPTLPRHIEA